MEIPHRPGGLLARILGRERSLLAVDLEAKQGELREAVGGSRLLVIGAAGSIGSAFVRQVVAFRPRALHLVDPSENNLVELVRELRSDRVELPEDFRSVAVALGSLEFDHFLASEPAYDRIVNLAAMKHVRSERDPFSLMRLLMTNVVFLDDLLRAVARYPQTAVFSVSSDKAVNPASLMGASKALMERLLLVHSGVTRCATTRFAN
ncbi:MAG: polysaccharide biosynthesis protein, partial [Magnetococcales bacterium]|nr:polysaccharide biosynthesis protein [Magnetococcales bacterium]